MFIEYRRQKARDTTDMIRAAVARGADIFEFLRLCETIDRSTGETRRHARLAAEHWLDTGLKEADEGQPDETPAG